MLMPERLLSGISVIFSIVGVITIIQSIFGVFIEHSLRRMVQPFMVGLGFVAIGLVLIFIVDFSKRLTRIEMKLNHNNHIA